MTEFIVTDNCLENKTILVTGAGDGIGKTAAMTYAKYGATVILLGKTVEKLEAVYDDIVAAGLPEPAIVPLDMKGATAQHYKDMVNTIVDQFKHLDGALLNASILGELTPFTQINSQIWDDVMQVNVTAQMYLAQALVPALIQAPNASLLFTTSGVGNKGRAFWGPYSVSKFATEGMMQVIADEYEGSGLRINAINPGATDTRMRQTAFPAEDKSKIASADDIMPAYLYLMSDAAKAVNGQRINAQG
ncbi:YciK family oxidoreductase [Thalassotalea sp. HSM 43]|uniref:YciK family oxidoreductase n=1 Tax=Thalassotalea sp. HSM 43 TaxID=2552945 RepID=UPI0010810D31|nr:YciK family oxidoreductase [Thalassotalea sp. HSM 43]QBY03217.1 YciK family oxidoreductase [Thalassotalea sp. HSM 43]